MSNTAFTQFEELTVTNAVLSLTASVYGNLNRAILTVADADIRFTVDGTTPTTDIGHIAYDSDEVRLQSRDEIVAFRAFRNDSADAELSASYGVERR